MNKDMNEYQMKLKNNISILIEKNELAEAKELIKQYEGVTKDDIDIYSFKGIIAMMEYRINEAERILLEGLAIDSENFDLLYNLAFLYQFNGQYSLAIEYYKRALKNADYKNQADEIYEILKGLEGITEQDKLEIYKSKLKKNIELLISQGLLQDAKDAVNEYDKISKNDIDIISFKSIIAMIEENIDEAERLLISALNKSKNNFDLLYNIGYLYKNTNRYREAILYYKRAKQVCIDKKRKEEIDNILNEITKNITCDGDNNFEKNYKKVLMIAHIFPPIGGSGVQRTLKFTKYLRNYGWEPIVITAGYTKYPLVDESLLDEIPEKIKVIRFDEDYTLNDIIIQEIFNLYKGIIKDIDIWDKYIQALNSKNENIQNLITIPDPYIFWANIVLKEIESYIDFNEIDLIYTTSGPYSDHIIGYYLKEKYNKPWVADFRDEWTNNPYADYDKTGIRYAVEYELEKQIVHCADMVITTTPVSSENYRKIFGLETEKVVTITNGYDESDFENIEISNNNEKFTIMHNGLLYGIRTPITFMMAVKNLIDKKQIDKNKIKIYFAWTENDKLWKEYANRLGVEKIFEFIGYLNHHESLKQAAKADVLLLIVGPGEKNKAMYPGKIFEYLRLGKPILSLAPCEGVVDRLIEETGRGYNIDFNDIEGIERELAKLYKLWVEKKDLHSFSSCDIKCFERKNLTKELSLVFDNLFINKSKNIKRKRIVFFTIKGGDKFLGDIIDILSEHYDVKKIIVTQLIDIEKGMEWGDICWFDWCDQIFVYASKLPIAKNKKIICRLHRYEAFTDLPTQVEWSNVDKVIFVAKHIMDKVLSTTDLSSEKCVLIPNGVNPERFPFKNREKGYNLACLGDLNLRKNPMLLMQCFYQLSKIDERYNLYFGGPFTDEMLKDYLMEIVKKLNLIDRVHFDGYIPNEHISEWLKDKQYIVTGSIGEGHPVGIMEAMSCGLKPVIHYFPGVDAFYPQKYIYHNADDFCRIITEDNYNSKEYHDYIQTNYSLELQLTKVLQVINEISDIGYTKCHEKNTIDARRKTDIIDSFENGTDPIKDYYDNFLDYLKKDRIRENPRHTYLKKRISQLVKPNMKVLDLGCGIGITTEYINSLGVQKVIGIDLSDRLIEYARKTVRDVEFRVGDITCIDLDEKFDVITLCDVIEHIPVEKYDDLFKVIKKHLKIHGKVYISIPDPEYQNFLREYRKDMLQIIDNSITYNDIDILCRKHGLRIMFFNSYGIWVNNQYNEYLICSDVSYTNSWQKLN